jgi:glycerol-3-phosphate acyltransferase PlsY
MELILYMSLSYLIGSIPFGFLVTRLAGYGDIRQIGSGNIGATNVLRTGNKKLAALTLLLDASKGAVAIFLLSGFSHPILIGLAAIIGHCFPIWLGLKGGKGVATTLGVLLVGAPIAGLMACIIWLLAAFITRISSLSALIAIGSAPLVTFYVYGAASALFCLLIAALVFIKHHANIQRLLQGEEPKIGVRK